MIYYQMGYVSRSQRLRLITLTETLIILDITTPTLIIILLYIERKKKMEIIFFVSSLTGSNAKSANLT